jgi:hypothetical protein
LIHDKSHIFDSTIKNQTLESVFKKIGVGYSGKLYRGITKSDIKFYKPDEDGNLKLSNYSSWTPDKNIAKMFGSDGIILTLDVKDTSVKFINYYKFLVDYMKYLEKTDYDEFDDIDGEYIIESALEEKEIILPIGLKLRLQSSKDTYQYIL